MRNPLGAALAALLLAALPLGACAPKGPPATVSLRLVGTPADARVTIDDQLVGPLSFVSARGVALPPGKHRLTVEAPGYFPVDRMLEAPENGAPIRLDVRLVPVPD
jgi:hypothetical protein